MPILGGHADVYCLLSALQKLRSPYAQIIMSSNGTLKMMDPGLFMNRGTTTNP